MKLETSINTNDRRSYLKIDTDDANKLDAALDTGYTYLDGKNLHDTVKALFENHAELYDYVGFDSSDEHGGSGDSFQSEGFRKFLDEFTNDQEIRPSYISRITDDEDALQQICTAIAQKLGDKLQEYEEQQAEEEEENRIARSTVQIDTEEGSTEELTDPTLLDQAIVIGNDAAHKIKVQKIQGARTLEEVEEQVKDDVRGVYETQIDTRVQQLKEQKNALKQQLEAAKEEMLIEGIKLVDEMDEWEVEDGYLVYQKDVHPTHVSKRYAPGWGPKKLTEEARQKFYIRGLKIPITQHVGNIDYEEGYHPHALGGGRGCAGDFGYPLREALERAPEQMKQINLHNHNENDAEAEITENLDEYTLDEDVDDVWEAE